MLQIILFLLIVIFLLLVFITILYFKVYVVAQKLPKNNPLDCIKKLNDEIHIKSTLGNKKYKNDTKKIVNESFTNEKFDSEKFDNETIKKNKKKKKILIIGDSITHGTVSVNYVEIIKALIVSKGYNEDDFDIINAGINSDLVYNVLQRIEPIIKCHPDIICIMIGTNDAHGSYNLDYAKKQQKRQNLPRPANFIDFQVNLKNLISILKEQTDAVIGLASIPTIGENRKDQIFQHVSQFISEIKRIAREFNIEYIQVYEEFEEKLKYFEKEGVLIKFNKNYKPYVSESKIMIKNTILHYLFGISFDKLSEKVGYLLHVDPLHLNTKGAKLVAEEMVKFIMKSL